MPRQEPAQAQRRLFYALARLCARLAAPQPLLIVIEDLHWSDTVTFDWLLYLRRRLRRGSCETAM